MIERFSVKYFMSYCAIFVYAGCWDQAVEIARVMRAKHLVLTHFSQRYPSATQAVIELQPSPTLSSVSSEATSQATSISSGFKFATAFDFLRFGFPSQMEQMYTATEAISKIVTVASAQASSSAVAAV
jgi:hypothetical protein